MIPDAYWTIVLSKAGKAEKCLLRHIDKRQKILNRRFCHSRRHHMRLEWWLREHGRLHFIGSVMVAQQNTRVARRATHAWERFLGVKERKQSPNGGRT